MRQLKRLLFIIPSLFVLGITIGFSDDHGLGHNQVKALLDSGKIISAEALIKDAMKRKAGRLLELELEVEEGRYMYEVEIIDDQGVVWELYYDARTGEFLKTSIEK